MDSLTTPIHIDLYDFEDPKYEDSKYVLTSPRSLEACARVGVKPIELLYKPLADFQDEYLTEDRTLQEVYNMYDDQENERLRVLKLCRQERDRLVNEDEVKSITRLSPIVGSYMRPTSPASESRSKSPGMEYGTRLAFASKSASLILDNKSKVLEKTSDDDRLSPVDSGSLQRIRTAWATSGGDGDQLELEEDGDAENKEKHLLEKPEKSTNKSSLRQRAASLERPRRLPTPSRDTGIRSRTNSERSGNLDNTWASLLKSSIQSAKPILDSKLRNKLKGCRTAGVRIPDRDQKILARIMAKEEDKKDRARMRETAMNVWEEERRKELMRQEREEVQRRRKMLEKSSERQKVLAAKEAKRKESQEAELKNLEQKIEVSDKHWQEQVARLERERRQKLIDKKEEEMKRRQSVERNLEAKEKENEEFCKTVVQYQEKALKKAAVMREAQLHEEKMKRRLQNEREMKEFKKRQQKVEKMTEEELDTLRASIDYKHKKAEEKFENISIKKQQEIEAHHRAKEKQERALKQNLEKMERDMEDYQKNLEIYRKVKEQLAEETVNMVTMKKKMRAQEERAQWEALQRVNYRRQKKAEAAKLEGVKESIAWKDAKAQVVQEEKEQTVSQLRALAHTSELLRGELKQKYNKDSFDKKVQKVELEAKIGAGHHGNMRNTSSVKLY